MSKPSTEQPDFDEDFTKAVAQWRDQHRLASLVMTQRITRSVRSANPGEDVG
jgi:hypothetical protein